MKQNVFSANPINDYTRSKKPSEPLNSNHLFTLEPIANSSLLRRRREAKEKFTNQLDELEKLRQSGVYHLEINGSVAQLTINSKLDESIIKLIKTIKKLEAPKSYKQLLILTDVLEQTISRLRGRCAHATYMDLANTMQGKPSTSMKLLGGMMIALGLALLALSIVFIPALTAFPIAMAVTSITVGTITTGAMVAGCSFFAKGCQTGLSKDMSNLEMAVLSSTASPHA